jgi:hypothetical protein
MFWKCMTTDSRADHKPRVAFRLIQCPLVSPPWSWEKPHFFGPKGSRLDQLTVRKNPPIVVHRSSHVLRNFSDSFLKRPPGTKQTVQSNEFHAMLPKWSGSQKISRTPLYWRHFGYSKSISRRAKKKADLKPARIEIVELLDLRISFKVASRIKLTENWNDRIWLKASLNLKKKGFESTLMQLREDQDILNAIAFAGKTIRNLCTWEKRAFWTLLSFGKGTPNITVH